MSDLFCECCGANGLDWGDAPGCVAKRERDEARALVRKLRNAGRCHTPHAGDPCHQYPCLDPDEDWCEWCRVAAEVDEGGEHG